MDTKEALLVCWCVAVDVRASVANEKLRAVKAGAQLGKGVIGRWQAGWCWGWRPRYSGTGVVLPGREEQQASSGDSGHANR